MAEYRTGWISDIHLGTRGCNHKRLKDFLRKNKFEKLYLVGDIVDIWRISKGNWYFPQEHVNIIRQFLTLAKQGTEIIYISGNHDEFLRTVSDFDINMGNIVIKDEDIHLTAEGKEYLVCHGDDYDNIFKYHRWLAIIGDSFYNLSIYINIYLAKLRAFLGREPWSFSNYLKKKVKLASRFIEDFEDSISKECKRRKCYGVVCGHIHHAEMKYINGVHYCNDGDWVESCTALVETQDGKLKILDWLKDEQNFNSY